MKHLASTKFWKAYRQAPSEVQRSADKSFALLKQNPRHPSLHFKRIGKLWSARVNEDYRVLAFEQQDDLVWFWIGPHAEYDRLLRLR